ncbi:MAG TPA: nitronate monooxygenase [Candidatus Saccharimonadales bacterium]|nr:nitronate monooxygenase [Candidatus Saccharimonadales bacterium]
MNYPLDPTIGKLHSSLCDLMKIKYPIIQAGMSGFTTPSLVAEVSNAGGLGILGAARLSPSKLKESILEIRKKTDHPFGVNLLLAPPEYDQNNDVPKVQSYLNKFRQRLNIPLSDILSTDEIKIPSSTIQEKLQIIFEENVPLLSIGMGNPAKIVKQAHNSETKIMAMVTTVNEALSVVEAEVDIIAVQGAEAGGHRSTFEMDLKSEVPLVGTMALVPQVVDALSHNKFKNIPIVASGGITDGRGLIAAFSLGADGILVGTRFLMAEESSIFQGYKERIITSDATDTIVTKVFSGRHARCIKNEFVNDHKLSGQNPLSWPFQAIAADDIYNAALLQNNPDFFPLTAGQSVGGINERGQKASEIVEEIIVQAKEVLDRLTK